MESNQLVKNYLPNEIDDLVIFTGNLLNFESIKRKPSILPSDEILESITLVLSKWQETVNYINGNCAIVGCSEPEKIADRQSVKIIAKVFTFNNAMNNCSVFNEVVNVVMDHLDVSSIDSLILSIPSHKSNIEMIKPHWKCAEQLVVNGQASTLGISNLNTEQLIELYEWAQFVKPSTNQINFDTCCLIPPEMSLYAKEHNIQLLTHNDPDDFVPEEKMREMLTVIVGDPEKWKRYWIVRYTVIVTGKGIIQDKGYIVSAKKH